MEITKGPGELVKEITADLSTLVRKEIELAKKETSELIRSKLISAGLALVALVMAILVLPFVLLTLIEVLAIWLPRAGAAAIVTGLMVAVAVTAFILAKRFFGAKLMPVHTIRTLKEDVEWAKHLKK